MPEKETKMIESEQILDFNSPFYVELSEGQRIRKIRKDLKMSQKQFAQKLNVTKLCVARWETDSRKCKGAAKVLLHVMIKFNLWDQI